MERDRAAIERAFDREKVEKVAVASETSAPRMRRKLKPKCRVRSELLLLLYQIFEEYEVEFLDELEGPAAWGRIMSGKFTSDSIKPLSAENTKRSFLVLNGGEEVYRSGFLRRYIGRFGPPEPYESLT
jgi:hypothetical protein